MPAVRLAISARARDLLVAFDGAREGTGTCSGTCAAPGRAGRFPCYEARNRSMTGANSSANGACTV